jgi:predicted metalloprotease
MGGGAVMLALLAALLLGQDPGKVLETIGASTQQVPQQVPQQTAQQDELTEFVRVVLGDTEDVWNQIFSASGARYREPTLVLYSDMTETACGYGQAAAGPFYCPADQQLYLDLSFLGQLKRMGASGDFAFAYVIAHEIGHHIQTLQGISHQIQRAQSQMRKADANALQVRMELQADCYAGVWAHHAHRQRQILERGDVDEGLQAAAAVGDDQIQRSAGRRVHPESFTHGSSEQRVSWFRRGLETGNVQACDTLG